MGRSTAPTGWGAVGCASPSTPSGPSFIYTILEICPDTIRGQDGVEEHLHNLCRIEGCIVGGELTPGSITSRIVGVADYAACRNSKCQNEYHNEQSLFHFP